MRREVLEPLLFYVLHRASNEITDPKNLGTRSSPARRSVLFIKNETIRNYVVQAQKTWAQAPSAMILAAPIHQELEESGMLAIVARAARQRSLPRQSGHEPEVYREAFHLTTPNWTLIDGLVSTGANADFARRRPPRKHLNVDSVSHWMATNNAREPHETEYFDRFDLQTGFAISRRLPFQPRALAGSTPTTKHKGGKAVNHLKFIYPMFIDRPFRQPSWHKIRTHGAVSLAGHRPDPCQGEIYNPNRTTTPRRSWRAMATKSLDRRCGRKLCFVLRAKQA